eukprot:329304-Hanusia_phi.AAC.1
MATSESKQDEMKALSGITAARFRKRNLSWADFRYREGVSIAWRESGDASKMFCYQEEPGCQEVGTALWEIRGRVRGRELTQTGSKAAGGRGEEEKFARLCRGRRTG